VDHYLKENEHYHMPKKASAPIKNDYKSEIDITSELCLIEAAYFLSLIEVLRWIVELGRCDLSVELSMLSSYLTLPHVGHLEQVFSIFRYLQRKHNTEISFDPSYPQTDMDKFERKD